MNALTRPAPHGRIHNWLGRSAVDRLLEFARQNRERFRPTGLRGNVIDPQKRISEKIARPEIAGEIEMQARECLPRIFAALGTSFEPSKFEIELVAHRDGAFYARHSDSRPLPGPGDRVVSVVYYFFREPKPFTGGQLRLHALQGGAYADVEPENDMLAFFPSWFPHEVLPVSCPSGDFMDARFAINCWVRG